MKNHSKTDEEPFVECVASETRATISHRDAYGVTTFKDNLNSDLTIER